ncbi:MAG: radical SAM protein [Anaeroplasmataceae bacterium]|nr:radical SAM protein [Anaeroplasmataceae bacterium]
MENINYWDEFEYSKLKLILNNKKVDSILRVKNHLKNVDEFFPISVELHLTDLCNLNCEWCTDKELRKNKATLDLKVIEKLFCEFGNHGTGVTLEGGGEPTLHPCFRQVVETGKKFNIDMGLITNGIMDISEFVQAFRWIRVSLDSSTKEEYRREKGVDCFERVLENLEKISQTRKPKETFLGVGYVLTTRNGANLLELVKRLDSIGVDYIYLRPVEEAEEITPSLESLLDLRRHLAKLTEDTRIKYMLTINDRVVDKNAGMPCVAHSLTSIIHANGDVALCEKRREDGIILGNLSENSFEKIWLSSYRMEASQKLLHAECQKGCGPCRMTGFNRIFEQLEKVHSKHFI